MGTVRKKATLINDAFGAAVSDATTRGRPLLDNAV